MGDTVISGDYEWDAVKAATNVKDHGVAFEEAIGACDDTSAVTTADATEPDRLNVVGFSKRARLLFVVTTERGERTRIISARKATTTERVTYAKG